MVDELLEQLVRKHLRENQYTNAALAGPELPKAAERKAVHHESHRISAPHRSKRTQVSAGSGRRRSALIA